MQDQRIIDGLERSGYAVRRRDAGDRRRVLVERTEAGGQVMDRAREVAAARLGDLLDIPPGGACDLPWLPDQDHQLAGQGLPDIALSGTTQGMSYVGFTKVVRRTMMG